MQSHFILFYFIAGVRTCATTGLQS